MRVYTYDDIGTKLVFSELTEGFPKGVSLIDFIKNLNTALKYLKPDLDFFPAYPEQVLFYDDYADRFKTTITWDVSQMAPTALGGKSLPNASSGTREVKPRLRDTYRTPDGKEFRIYGQIFRAFVQFDVWALTAAEAEYTADWFMNDFMAHFGESFGSPHVYFWERKRDRELLQINNKLQTRSLIYSVEVQEVIVKPVDVIERVKAVIDTAGQNTK